MELVRIVSNGVNISDVEPSGSVTTVLFYMPRPVVSRHYLLTEHVVGVA